MEGQDLTKGNIREQLWSLAWPLMLSVFFYTLYNLVDTFWVSKLSAESIAAVSISQIIIFAMVSLSMGISVGSGVIMAMRIGAKKIQAAEQVLGQSFVLAGIAGIFFTSFALLLRDQLLSISGATGAIFAPALEYFTITAAGSVLFFFLMTIVFVFNSQGDTLRLAKYFLFSTLINIILDPILIFGWYGFPELGISGAAAATLISQTIFITIAIRSLKSKSRKIRFHFHNLVFKWQSVKKVLNIGIPASLTQVINPAGLAVLMFITSLGFMEPGTIALSIGFRVEFFAFLPAIGFGFGAVALISQSIGAGNIDRAKKVFNLAVKYSFFAATGLGIIALIFANGLIAIFTDDPTVTEFTQAYLWTVPLSYGFIALTLVEASAFQAINRSWPGFWIFFLRFVVISIPLSYVLTSVFDFPIMAVWISLMVGNIVSSVIGYLWISGVLKKLELSKATG